MALLPQVTLPLTPCKFNDGYHGYVDMDLVRRACEVFTPPRSSTKKCTAVWTGGSERTPEGFLPPLMDGIDDEEDEDQQELCEIAPQALFQHQVNAYIQQQHQQQQQAYLNRQLFVPVAAELPRESENCLDHTTMLQYAAPRGSNLRISWRNKLWSNNALLQSRYGPELPRYFRENYADRSPTSEPLLHNNYPFGSRVYFQGQITAAHCVCHHLVQIFENFSVSEDGKPDPLGLQAIWIAPSQASGKIYGYAKFTSAVMAGRAVVGLKQKHEQTETMVTAEDIDVLVHVCGVLNPPVNLNMYNEMMPGHMGWSSKGLALLRSIHTLEMRLQAKPSYSSSTPPAHVVGAAMAAVKNAASVTFGNGIITPAVIDSGVYGKVCCNQQAPVSKDPLCFEDISLANEQRPGHRGRQQ